MITYIQFAYKVWFSEDQAQSIDAPKWIASDRFAIEAKANGLPTKDQVRLMVQPLAGEHEGQTE
ncbi:MAG TPA: DUF3738 domain-containing protein [Bryobacteraceae bacterium]|nr:DUF3738 domain-containing protein [Bryobacteraceae bacterium]